MKAQKIDFWCLELFNPKCVKIFFRGSDDPHHDRWYIIRTDLIHKDDNFHSVIALFDRFGTHLPQHVLCYPRAYSVSDNLTEKELKAMRDFALSLCVRKKEPTHPLYQPIPDVRYQM